MPKPVPARAAFALTAALTTSLVLAACSTTGADTDEAVPTTAVGSPGAAFGHVHGLGMNPADETVYVATHHGLYTLDDGDVSLAGPSRADLMGFTALAEDTFLASGHPAPGERGPGSLGLIRSTDAGRTWQEVSLGGQSDFHGLTAAGDRVYGLDSTTGTLMRSDDGGETWQQAARLPARDLDVDPADPDRVVATTPDGLMVSTDGGAAFAPAAQQPPRPLVVVDHLPPREGQATVMVGLDIAGALWRFELAWTSAGPENGEPSALTAVDEDTHLAAFGTDVARTDDGGRTWEKISGPAR